MDQPFAPLLLKTSFHDLQVVLAVAEAGSFRQGAQRLKIAQSVASRHVRKLEDMLGVSLFE